MAKKLFLHIPNENACSLYRGTLPLKHLYSFLSEHDILIVGDEQPLRHEEFDAYIFNRVVKHDFYKQCVELLIKHGKHLIWQSDDDVWNIPPWNPSRKLLGDYDLVTTNYYIEKAEKLIVSTQPLADLVDEPSKTVVLPNLVELTFFNNKIVRNEKEPIKILWAGSVSHDADLDVIVEPISRLLEEYQEKIAVIFWGYLPTNLANYERTPGFPNANLVPKYKNLFWGEWFSIREYYHKLRTMVPDIAIMPLDNCLFNESKSAIKYYEMSLAGAACVATDLHPYRCIKNRETGILVPVNDKEAWYDTLKELIEDREFRHRLNSTSIEQVRQEFSWAGPGKKLWQDTFLDFMQSVKSD